MTPADLSDTSDALARARRDLAAPAGERGSGRLRYGAAMTLHQAGALSDEVLEVYRICALLDGEDPDAERAARGLAPGAEAPVPTAGAAILALVEAADDYLATLSGPGVAEVRAGIASARGATPGPCPGGTNPVVSAWLGPALATLAATRPRLARAIADAAPHLAWGAYDLYPRDEIGADFADNHAFASIIGEDAPLAARDFDLGLFLIAPHVLYRDRCHRAPELYAPLTGPHGWRFGPGRPLIVKPAHAPVWNDPFAPHATKAGAVPFLCLFGWTRDVNEPARVIPAGDWPELEALRLAP